MCRRRPHRVERSALLLLLAMLGGCGHAPEKPANARLNQALQLSQLGHGAYGRGDAAAAIGHFQGALQLDLSIENQAGIVADRINLSQAHEAAGDLPAARRQLDALLGDKSLQLGAEQRARVHAAVALLALRQGHAEEGEQMIGAARLACGEACPSLAPILNIRARLQLDRGNPAGALASATESLARLGAADQVAERANALRLVGQARLALGDAAATEALQQALALDRELGKPARIVNDLLLLARAQAAIGNAGSASEYRRRALTVAEAAADPALTKRVQQQQIGYRP